MRYKSYLKKYWKCEDEKFKNISNKIFYVTWKTADFLFSEMDEDAKMIVEDCLTISWMEAFLAFLHCMFSDVSSNSLQEKRHSRIGCICVTFSTVCFQMSPQIACERRGIVTLVACF